MKERKRGQGYPRKRLWIISSIVVVAVLVVVLVLVFNSANCDDWDCFNSHLESCDRAEFVGGDKMIFEYEILGDKGDDCIVEVELLQGELNNQDSLKLEGLEMKCSLPKGVVMAPESALENCHGLLKEGWQDLVIEKLHTYLVQNLGKINLDVVDVGLNGG